MKKLLFTICALGIMAPVFADDEKSTDQRASQSASSAAWLFFRSLSPDFNPRTYFEKKSDQARLPRTGSFEDVKHVANKGYQQAVNYLKEIKTTTGATTLLTSQAVSTFMGRLVAATEGAYDISQVAGLGMYHTIEYEQAEAVAQQEQHEAPSVWTTVKQQLSPRSLVNAYIFACFYTQAAAHITG